MKTFRTIILASTLLIGGMAFTGCEDNNVSNSQQATPTPKQSESQAEANPMDSSEKKQVLDSINALGSQIETLTNEQENITSDLKTVSKEVSELKGSSHLFDLISWIVAAVALLVALITLIKLSSIQKRADRHHNDLMKLGQRISLLEQNPTRAKSTYSGISSNEYSSLISRISLIERQIDKMNQSQIAVPQNVVQNRPISDVLKDSTSEQNGYFGLPTQMSLTEAYFKKLSDIRESDSRFTVSVKDTKAEFRPLEGTQYLNDLKSNDAIKMALEIHGCAPSEANQMKVLMPGEAKKTDGRWIIIKKASIYLQS